MRIPDWEQKLLRRNSATTRNQQQTVFNQVVVVAVGMGDHHSGSFLSSPRRGCARYTDRRNSILVEGCGCREFQVCRQSDRNDSVQDIRGLSQRQDGTSGHAAIRMGAAIEWELNRCSTCRR